MRSAVVGDAVTLVGFPDWLAATLVVAGLLILLTAGVLTGRALS